MESLSLKFVDIDLIKRDFHLLWKSMLRHQISQTHDLLEKIYWMTENYDKIDANNRLIDFSQMKIADKAVFDRRNSRAVKNSMILFLKSRNKDFFTAPPLSWKKKVTT